MRLLFERLFCFSCLLPCFSLEIRVISFLFSFVSGSDVGGCKDDTIPAYKGASMQVIHAGMGVTDQVFDTFNKLLLGILTTSGVSQADAAAVGSVLVRCFYSYWIFYYFYYYFGLL
jgi:hypothetical protein